MANQKKIILFPNDGREIPVDRSRITVQLRRYDENGVYEAGSEDGEGNETIWLRGFSIDEAYETIKSALLNSRLIGTDFKVVQGKHLPWLEFSVDLHNAEGQDR
jgi:hypothetical protein